jgi:hypothetical protein
MSKNSAHQTVDQFKSWISDKVKNGKIVYKKKNTNPVKSFPSY